jgi:hypothetical protein
LDAWKGQLLLIEESLSRARGRPHAHDRHFATITRFPLRLDHVGCTLSGTAITLAGHSGKRPSLYQLTADKLVSIEFTHATEITFIEHFDEHVERRTTIRRVDGSTEAAAGDAKA